MTPPPTPRPARPRARPAAAGARRRTRGRCRPDPTPPVDLTLKPVSETPTEPTDYAAISLAFGSLLAGLGRERALGASRSRAPICCRSRPRRSRSRKLIVHDKAESWLREPFVDEEGDGKRPKGRRLRYAVGELLTCTRCMGAWSALGLVGLRLHAPRAGRTVTTVLAVSAGNDALQAGFSWLCSRANEQCRRRPAPGRKLRRTTRRAA